MKKPFTLSILLWCAIITTINAQNIGVNEDGSLPDASAILDVKSSNKGVLVPRLSTVQRIGIAQPAEGLLVFDTVTKSFWFYTGTNWKEVTGDNLGDHTATQNLQLLDNWISSDGEDEGIRINATGNVGVNTSNPQQKLFLEDGNLGIKRGINASNPSILFQNTGTKYGWSMYYKDISNDLIFAGGQENDPSQLSDLVTFKGNGNVGIGDPNPLFKLSVGGTANFSDAVTIGDYTFPATDGISGQVLSTNGSGILSWVQPISTDDQTLNLTNNTLSIEGGNSVDLSAYVDTDDQTLNLTNNTLSIEGGNSVDLSAYVDTDDQTLNLINNTLSIEGGNSVNLALVGDDLGNHLATQNIKLSNNWISYDGDDEGIAINIEGDVGIGINSLQQKFTVFDGNTTMKAGPNTNSPSLLFQNSGVLYGWRMYYENSTKNLVFSGGQNNDISSLTDYVTFKNDGNVGIGDSDPTFKLSVNGTANFTDEVTFETANFNNIGIGTPASTSSIPFLLKKAGASGPVGITQNVVGGGHTMEFTTQDGSGNQAVRFLLRGSNDASDIEFYTGGSGSESQSVMIEGDNGYMGVGTNTPSSSLHVRNNITASTNFVAEVENTANANNFSNGLLITAGQDVQTANNRFISFQRPDGTEIGAVRQISDSTVDFFTPSDRRLKTDFTKSSYGIKDLLQIEVRDYFYKGDLSNKKTGFIAQQLQPFFPDAVSEGGADAKTDPWMVNYGRLTPLIVQAIQDQHDYIISLEEEVAHLKSELAEVQSLKAEMAEIKAMLIKQRSSVQDEE